MQILIKFYTIVIAVKKSESEWMIPASEFAADGLHTGILTATDLEDLDVVFQFDNTQSLFSKLLLYCFEPVSKDLSLEDQEVLDTGSVQSTVSAQDRFVTKFFVPKHHCVAYKIQCCNVDVTLVDEEGKVLTAGASDASGQYLGSCQSDGNGIGQTVSMVVDNSKSSIFNWRSLSYRVLIGPRVQIESFDSGAIEIDIERWTKTSVQFHVPKHKAVTWKVLVKSQFSMIPSEIGVGVDVKVPLPEKRCGFDSTELQVYSPVESKSCAIGGRPPDERDQDYILILDNSGHLNLSKKDLSFRIIIGEVAFKPGSDMLLALGGHLPGIAAIGEVFFVVIESLKYLGSTVSSQLKNDYALSWVAFMVYSSFPSAVQKTATKQDITDILVTNRNLIVIMIDEPDEKNRLAKIFKEVHLTF